MTWHQQNPDDRYAFSNAWYDDLDAEQAEAEALADRLNDHAPTFAADTPPKRREATRPSIPAGRSTGPDAHPPARASGPVPSSTEQAANHPAETSAHV